MPFKNPLNESLVNRKLTDGLYESPGVGIEFNVKDAVQVNQVLGRHVPNPIEPIKPRRDFESGSGINIQDVLKEIYKNLKVDWNKIKEDLGGSLKKLNLAIIAFGDKDLINIELPNLRKLVEELESLISTLSKENQEKLRSQIAKIREQIKRKEKDQKTNTPSPEDKLLAERARFAEMERLKREAIAGFRNIENGKSIPTPERALEKADRQINEALKRIKDIFNQTVDPKIRREILVIIAILSSISALNTSGGETKSTTDEITSNPNTTSIIDGTTNAINTDNTEFNKTQRREQTPDNSVSSKEGVIDKLEGIKLQSREEAREMFGVTIGSVIGQRGANVISIENKTNNQGVKNILLEKNRKIDFVIVLKNENGETEGYLDLSKFIESFENNPGINLENIPDDILVKMLSNPLIYGHHEEISGEVTQNMVQSGEITGLRKYIEKIILDREIDRASRTTNSS